MLAEIITIGDEILIGQVVDTNASFIAQELDRIGVKIYQITSVQDNADHILKAFEEASEQVNLVVITGGLGPTKDDITKQTFCEFFEDALIENEDVVENIRQLFKKYQLNLPMQANLRQAKVPSKAEVLMNRYGTAPGMWMERDGVVFVSLPGVPFEMKHLIREEVVPRIVKRFDRPFIYHKTLLTHGMGESAVAERLLEWEEALPKDVKLAYLPSPGKVRLRVTSQGNDKKELEARVDAKIHQLKELLSDIVIGLEEETSIVDRIGSILISKNKFLSLAESCTGGRIASEIAKYPGVSAWFRGGVIPYETKLKTDILGVPKELIDTYNVVSLEVAEVMATQACKLLGSDFAISTTGIAGPTKGDGVDEVGTVCIAIATPNGVISEKFNFGNDRFQIVEKAASKSFELLWKEILKI